MGDSAANRDRRRKRAEGAKRCPGVAIGSDQSDAMHGINCVVLTFLKGRSHDPRLAPTPRAHARLKGCGGPWADTAGGADGGEPREAAATGTAGNPGTSQSKGVPSLCNRSAALSPDRAGGTHDPGVVGLLWTATTIGIAPPLPSPHHWLTGGGATRWPWGPVIGVHGADGGAKLPGHEAAALPHLRARLLVKAPGGGRDLKRSLCHAV